MKKNNWLFYLGLLCTSYFNKQKKNLLPLIVELYALYFIRVNLGIKTNFAKRLIILCQSSTFIFKKSFTIMSSNIIRTTFLCWVQFFFCKLCQILVHISIQISSCTNTKVNTHSWVHNHISIDIESFLNVFFAISAFEYFGISIFRLIIKSIWLILPVVIHLS